MCDVGPCYDGNLRFIWLTEKRSGAHFTLQWRHNGRDRVSNHQPHDCLLNRLFRRRSKKTSKLRVTGLYAGNSPGQVNSPHKGSVTRKMFPFGDVITKNNFPHCNSNSMEISFCSHPCCSKVSATKFCIWHDNCATAVVTCAKFCSNKIP